jgi:hypothetical protein
MINVNSRELKAIPKILMRFDLSDLLFCFFTTSPRSDDEDCDPSLDAREGVHLRHAKL